MILPRLDCQLRDVQAQVERRLNLVYCVEELRCKDKGEPFPALTFVDDSAAHDRGDHLAGKLPAIEGRVV